jgi:hypothetical protein
LFHVVTCAACGTEGKILVENPAELPRCSICGHALSLRPPAGPPEQTSVDADQIVAWLSVSEWMPSAAAASEYTCRSCGYSGAMDRDPARAGLICPACQTAYRAPPDRRTRAFDCPHCRTAFTLSAGDCGKTTVCPACKYFLGCIWPHEKRPRRLFGSRA